MRGTTDGTIEQWKAVAKAEAYERRRLLDTVAHLFETLENIAELGREDLDLGPLIAQRALEKHGEGAGP